MLIKIDHTVASLLAEDRADLVAQLTNSSRLYSWVDGENIPKTIDLFALANPRATFGDFIEWTKRTYLDRLRAITDSVPFTGHKLEGDYNPTATNASKAEFGKHGASVSVIESIPAVRKAGPRKVAEPGQEAEVDAEDAAALANEPTDNPIAPPAGLSSLPPLEPGQQSEGDTGGPVPSTPTLTPLAKRGLTK